MNLFDHLPQNNWSDFFLIQKEKEYFKILNNYLVHDYNLNACTPQFNLVFNPFHYCDLNDLKILILGQDPYPQPKQANGIAFGCNLNLSQSLRNIFKNIAFNYPFNWEDADFSLKSYAKQGVLFLNTIATARVNSPLSHAKFGWDFFCYYLFNYIYQVKKNLVVLLWGKKAQAFNSHFIEQTNYLVLQTSHPSPLSVNRGFKTSKQFIIANQYLNQHQLTEINWTKTNFNDND